MLHFKNRRGIIPIESMWTARKTGGAYGTAFQNAAEDL